MIDASRLITEAMVQSGADVFIGYPITPSNLFYSYAKQRFPEFLAGPDEISVLQWMSGYAAAGKLPVTATAFPGLALMTETLNMAYMMELPMVLIITQRLGPSTGSATTGAQGDVKFLEGIISGGFPIPTFSPSTFEEAWQLSHTAVQTAISLRTPVVLLTSKEMVMTQKSIDLSTLPPIEKVARHQGQLSDTYQPYKTDESLVPPMVTLGDDTYQARFNSSTHDMDGLIRKGTPESLANTARLRHKMQLHLPSYAHFSLDEEAGATTLLVSWGISADACRDAVVHLRKDHQKVALLVVQTLLPVSETLFTIMQRYQKLIFVEENNDGHYKEILFGKQPTPHCTVVTNVGSMVQPTQIITTFMNIHHGTSH